MTRFRMYVLLALLVAGVKILQLAVDATPLFFLGDSATYIQSAVEGFLPICRSFTYGWLIRWFALWPGTLDGLIGAQVLAGGVTAWLLGVLLIRFWAVRPIIAAAASLVFAFDPLQLLHERMVLAETFSLLLFAVQLALACSYLERPRMVPVLLIAIVGIALVSLRFVFIPVALALPVLLPALTWLAGRKHGASPRISCIVLHLLIGIAATGWLHDAYRAYIGRHFGLPGYQHMDGLMLLAAWAPVVKPDDAANPRTAELIRTQSEDPEYPLADPGIRESQLWDAGGLIDHLRHDLHDGYWVQANTEAKQICRNTWKRDPAGVLGIGWINYRGFFQRGDAFRESLLDDQGTGRALDPEFIVLLKERVDFEAASIHLAETPSRRFHLAGGLWYGYLALSPLMWLACLWLGTADSRGASALIFLVGTLLMAATSLAAADTVFRYLHPYSFTGILALAILLDALARSAQKKEGTELNSIPSGWPN